MKKKFRVVWFDNKFYAQRRVLVKWVYLVEHDYKGNLIKVCRDTRFSAENVVLGMLQKYEKKKGAYVIKEYVVDRKGVYYMRGEDKVYINTAYRFSEEDCK